MSSFQDTGPVTDAASITPNDDTDLDIPRALWIGGAGDMSVVMAEDKDNSGKAGATVTFVGITAGTLLPIRVRRVRSTGLTASDILGLY